MTKPSHRPVRVGLISLGCAKNLVDAEIMLGSLLQSGIEITNEAEQADVVIVNTCSFIDAAQKESVEAILESAQARARTNPAQGLIVSGCLPQRFGDELPKLLPEVDAFMGIDQVAQVPEIVRQALAGRREKARAAPGRAVAAPSLSRPLQSAWPAWRQNPPPPAAGPVVRVHRAAPLHPRLRHAALSADAAAFRLRQDRRGLQSSVQLLHHPAGCAAPIAAAPRRTWCGRPRQLLAGGVKELNLISQDSTYYGLDLRPDHSRRDFLAGKIRGRRARPAGRGAHPFHAAARAQRAARRFLDPPALHPSGPLDGRID